MIRSLSIYWFMGSSPITRLLGLDPQNALIAKTSHSMLLSQFGLARYLQLMIYTYLEQTIHRKTNQSDTKLYQCMSLQRTMMELCSNGRNLLHGPLNVSTRSERNTMITMCSMRGKTGGTFILVNQWDWMENLELHFSPSATPPSM